MKILKSNPKSFIKAFFLGLLIMPLLVIIFNIIIDPFGLFNIVNIPGFNAVKPAVTTQLRLAKSHAVHSIKPTAAIFGTSRAELSMDPEHPGFTDHKAYNMAMGGSGIYEIYTTLKHTYYASGKRLKLAIIGLDFLMFNANREARIFGNEVIGYDEDRMMLSESSSYIKSFKHDAKQILSTLGVRHSFETIFGQNSHELYIANGMRHPTRNSLEIPTYDSRKEVIINEWYYVAKIWACGPERQYCTKNNANNIDTFETFRALVRFAKENNIELKFYVSPTHARKLLTIKEAGLWPALAKFKIGLVNILDQVAKEGKVTTPYELWDFMTVNSITSEKLTELGTKDKMKWYWEISHFKKNVGDMVLNRVLNMDDLIEHDHADFGQKLTVDNVQQSLDKTLKDSIAYAKKYPKYNMEIKESVAKAIVDRPEAICRDDL